MKCKLSKILFAIYLLLLAFICFWRFNHVFLNSFSIGPVQFDKVVHFVMFLPFPVLAYLSFGKADAGGVRMVGGILLIFFIGCVLAAGTELLQGFIPYRTADVGDFKADALGLAVGSVLCCILRIGRS